MTTWIQLMGDIVVGRSIFGPGGGSTTWSPATTTELLHIAIAARPAFRWWELAMRWCQLQAMAMGADIGTLFGREPTTGELMMTMADGEWTYLLCDCSLSRTEIALWCPLLVRAGEEFTLTVTNQVWHRWLVSVAAVMKVQA